MADKVITIESVDDEEDYNKKEYRKVISTDGLEYKIKQGKGGKLKEKWDLLRPGATLKLTFGEFTKDHKTYDFVQDIESVSDEVAKEAIHKHGVEQENQQQSIDSRKAIEEIGMNLRLGIYNPENSKLYPELTAHAHLQGYDRWIQSRTLPFGEGKILDPVPNAGEERREGEKAIGATTPIGEYPREPQSIQSIGGLMNALREDTKDMKLTIPTVEKVLSIGLPIPQHLGDIADIPQAYKDFLSWHRGENKEVKDGKD